MLYIICNSFASGINHWFFLHKFIACILSNDLKNYNQAEPKFYYYMFGLLLAFTQKSCWWTMAGQFALPRYTTWYKLLWRSDCTGTLLSLYISMHTDENIKFYQYWKVIAGSTNQPIINVTTNSVSISQYRREIKEELYRNSRKTLGSYMNINIYFKYFNSQPRSLLCHLRRSRML